MKTPKYMKDFVCNGQICPDRCCGGGLQVTIDKTTFEKYKAIENKEDKEVIRKYIKKIENSTTPMIDAYIETDENGNCKFLSREHLCKIQLKYGEYYLGNACFIYPRIYTLYGDRMEQNATLGCPLIAELALLNGSTEFEETDEKIDHRLYFLNGTNDQEMAKKYKIMNEESIRIVQNRKNDLDVRLSVLKLFCEKEQILNHNEELEIENYFLNFDLVEFEKVFNEKLSKVQNSRFRKYYYSATSKKNNISHEVILENYLVNYISAKMFPYGGDLPNKNFVKLCVHYKIIESLIKNIDDENEVVGLIQSYTKHIELTDIMNAIILNFDNFILKESRAIF